MCDTPKHEGGARDLFGGSRQRPMLVPRLNGRGPDRGIVKTKTVMKPCTTPPVFQDSLADVRHDLPSIQESPGDEESNHGVELSVECDVIPPSWPQEEPVHCRVSPSSVNGDASEPEWLSGAPVPGWQEAAEMEKRLAMLCERLGDRVEARVVELCEGLDTRMSARLAECACEWQACRELLCATCSKTTETVALASEARVLPPPGFLLAQQVFAGAGSYMGQAEAGDAMQIVAAEPEAWCQVAVDERAITMQASLQRADVWDAQCLVGDQNSEVAPLSEDISEDQSASGSRPMGRTSSIFSEAVVARPREQWFACLRDALGEPDETGRLFWISRSWRLGVASVIITVANSVLVAIDADLAVESAFSEAMGGVARQHEEWAMTLLVSQRLFTGWLFLEIMINIGGTRSRFFFGPDRYWNLMDSLLLFSVLLINSMLVANSSVVQVIRLARCFRAFSAIRAARRSESLNRILSSMSSVLVSLGWSACILFIFVYIVGVMMMDGVAAYVKDARPSEDSWPASPVPAENTAVLESLHRYYGGAGRTWLTLFQAISGGDWTLLSGPLSSMGAFWIVLWCCYIFFVVFGCLNVLTGVVVSAVARPLSDEKACELEAEAREESSLVGLLRTWLLHHGMMQDALISCRTFVRMTGDAGLVARLRKHGIKLADFAAAFPLIDLQGEGRVSVETVAQRLLELRGEARSHDLARMAHEIDILGKGVAKLVQSLEELEIERRSEPRVANDVITLV
mmetsp:Transcript_9192/g.26427  ORF Transcript_9192/g.26427 Transcript_9192/m.26427 type:complete len:743 (+) Transcript_9192:91-2319(+)